MGHKQWKIPPACGRGLEELIHAGYSKLLSTVLLARGITSVQDAKQYLSRDDSLCQSPFSLQDMDKAVTRIALAIERNEKVAVYGDYDVDGITASCLVCDYLRSRGVPCEVYIPDRISEGYGVNAAALRTLSDKGVSLVITVDCGITAVTEVEFAKTIGMDIIITDHHECPQTLPDAVAVIDPKRHDGDGHGDGLAGVGVAFKLVCAMENDTRTVLASYSDLVAVGTIADVMPLTGENRLFVYHGLEKLKANPRSGFAALLEEASNPPKPINTGTVGFTIAPRINAAGRLCKTETSINLLLTKNINEATTYARELCEMNHTRQELEGAVWREAMERLSGARPTSPIVLESESWHPGVVGIAASRLAEEFELPTIMICLEGESGKGSCRSCGSFNLFDALTACSDTLESFGGHAFAAGLSIRKDRINDFRAALADYYNQNLPTICSELVPEVLIDQPSLLSREGVASLDELEPCGGTNPRPLMCMCSANLESISAIGGGKHIRMKISKCGVSFDCIYFSHTLEQVGLREGQLVDLCFVPQINEFHSRVSVQLLVTDIRRGEAAEKCKEIIGSSRPELCLNERYTLGRAELGLIWRSLKGNGGQLVLELDKLGRDGFGGTEPIKLCLGLKIFMELGLLSLELSEANITIKINSGTEKAALENSPLFKALNLGGA